MSTVENPTRIESSTPVAGGRASVTPPADATASRVYDELGRLAELMPERYREVFCFRWGLRGEFSHVVTQVRRKFEIPQSTVEAMLERCLWNIARHARTHELPALRGMLGEDRERWAERAWAHAQRRWGNQQSEFSEIVLLLAVAGLDVSEAYRVAGQHMVDLGLARTNRWARATRDGEQTDPAGVVDRMLAHVTWPYNPVQLSSLAAFSVRRRLPAWADSRSGVFRSEKLQRLVQFDSELELLILRALDADRRVVDYCEQPVTIPYVLDGEPHEYTPDVIVRLVDGRAFVVEAKPADRLGDFTNWMKWASLARWSERAGLGFWVGSPQRSIIEHRRLQPDPERRELVTEEVAAGAVSGKDCRALVDLVDRDQLGLIAAAELLDWRGDIGRVRVAEDPDREEARQFWALIDRHQDAPSPVAWHGRLEAPERT